MNVLQRPRKRFGQHFLHDNSVIQRIIAAINPSDAHTLIEIGPGRGALTFPLLQQVEHLHVVEFDRDLVAYLQQRAGTKLHIHAADVLQFDFATLASTSRQLRVVGNLPYNISTPLLFHLLDYRELLDEMVFMLQKEVVERLVAAPNTTHYGRLSVMVQVYCQCEHLFDVAPSAFNPPPKVDSSIVRLTPHRVPPVTISDSKTFAHLVSLAFAQRRKTLRNNLKSVLTATQLEQIGINPQARAETLDLAAFATLTEIMRSTCQP